MPDKPLSYEETYARLKAAYITRLESDATAIGAVLADMLNAPQSKDDLLKVQHIAHGLAGSGTTFGFPGITDAGRKADALLEKIIRSLRDDDVLIPSGDTGEIQGVLNLLCVVCRDAVKTAPDQNAAPAAPVEDKPVFEGKKSLFVLIVDDDINLRNMIAMKLEQRGFITGGAGSDQEMRLSMEKRRPDVIILDLNLPDHSGHEILRRLKAHADHATIPVLMLTASAKQADVVAALHSGAASYIVKPADVNAISDRIEKLCANMRRTVLIADNDQLILALLQSKFKSRGFNVVLTDNGLAALEHVRLVQPDLMILDIAMPGMDGLSVLRMMRKDKKTQNTPVIIASAHAAEQDRAAGMDAGAQAYIPKPFNADDLIRHSITLLNKEQTHDQ